jgi:hypothetical protein
MVARDAETNLAVDLEAAGGGEEAEGGRAEGVGHGEDDAAVVDAGGEGGGGGGPAQGEVPFEEVGFERLGVVVGGGVGCEFGGFFDCGGGMGLVGWLVG